MLALVSQPKRSFGITSMTNCLIIGKVWPEPTSTAAGLRILDLIKALQLGGWQLHFASAAQRGEHTLDLEAIGVRTHKIAVNDAAFDPGLKHSRLRW